MACFFNWPGSDRPCPHKFHSDEQTSISRLRFRREGTHDLPGSWLDADYRALLAQLEVDEVEDVSGSDLLDFMFSGMLATG